MARTRPPRSARGFTLLELMIALVIGLVLVAGIGYAYLASSRTYKAMDAASRLQEGARYAFERMAYDVRQVGFAGCGYATFANVLTPPSAWDMDLFGQTLVGYEEGAGTYPAGVEGNVLRGDALTIVRADDSHEYIVDSHNPAAASLHLTANHDIKQGEILVITDCSHAAVFQMTNVNNNDTVAVVDHNTGNATTPGNCTKGLGSPVDCGNPLGTSYAFAQGSRIFRVSGTNFHIRANANGEPTLYRQRLTHSGGNAASVAEELVEGVEDMRLKFGVDGDDDKAVDSYATASAVADWSKVRSVRVSLLMVTRRNERITTKDQTYTFDGTTATSTDGRLRRVFTTTIAVRNRL